MLIVKSGKVSTVFTRMIRVSFVDETELAKYETVKKVWDNASRAFLLRNPGNPEERAAQFIVSVKQDFISCASL